MNLEEDVIFCVSLIGPVSEIVTTPFCFATSIDFVVLLEPYFHILGSPYDD